MLEGREMEKFFKSVRNYIILTNSGKPVFSTSGDIYALSSIYASLYAMISKAQTFEFDTSKFGESRNSSQSLKSPFEAWNQQNKEESREIKK